MKSKRNKQLTFLSISAAMAALAVVFTRFIGFSPEGTPFRFEIGFLPIAVVAYIAGPLYAGGAYLVADVIGSFFSGYAPNPVLTVAQVLFGVIMGLFFYRKHSMMRTVLCFSVIALAVEVLIKAPAIGYMYGYTWQYTIATRLLNALINLPIRIFTYYFTIKALKKPLEDII